LRFIADYFKAQFFKLRVIPIKKQIGDELSAVINWNTHKAKNHDNLYKPSLNARKLCCRGTTLGFA